MIVYRNTHHYQFVPQSTKILTTLLYCYKIVSKYIRFTGSLLLGELKYRWTIEEYYEACPWLPCKLTSWKWCVDIIPHHRLTSQWHWCIQWHLIWVISIQINPIMFPESSSSISGYYGPNTIRALWWILWYTSKCSSCWKWTPLGIAIKYEIAETSIHIPKRPISSIHCIIPINYG